MRLFSSLTFGLLLVIAGILFILKNTLNINIPITRIIFGILIILFGLNVLFGSSISKGDKDLIFSSGTLVYEQNKQEYLIIFGSGVVDLSNITTESYTGPIEVTTVFGSAVLKLNPDIPVNVDINTVFGTTKTPENEINFFGDSSYRISGDNSKIKPISIETNTVFGELKILSGR